MRNVTMLNVIILNAIMLNVIWINVIILNIMLNVNMLNVIILNVIILNAIMLNVIILNVIMLNVIMLNVMALIEGMKCEYNNESRIIPQYSFGSLSFNSDCQESKQNNEIRTTKYSSMLQLHLVRLWFNLWQLTNEN
jgi:hypothetical protein